MSTLARPFMPVACFPRRAGNGSPLTTTVTVRSLARCLVRLRGLVLVVLLSACAREPVAPSSAAPLVLHQTPRAAAASVVPVSALLGSFSIGGVYSVLPRGGYAGLNWYAQSPEKEQYAGTVSLHPSGLEFPVGLPIRILAEGHYVSSATAAFQQDYCSVSSHATDPLCVVASFTYTVHGLADGPGVLRPYEPGMGLALTWSRTAGYNDRFYGLFPSAEFFRGRVPAADTATVRELHFRRNGCCYYIPWGTTAAWEAYEGSWRFGAVPDDGGQAELGVPPVLRLQGPRTDAPMAESVTFAVAATAGESIVTTRWWYVRAANNTFDGEPVPLVTITHPWTMQIPRYPAGQRAVFEELATCAGHATCTYQPVAAGAVVAQATLGDGRVLAARNTGASGAHVKITADATTLTYGDTTVFRVTAPGANELTVTGYYFLAVGGGASSALLAMRQTRAFRASGSEAVRKIGSTLPASHSTARQDKPAVAVERGTSVPVRRWKHFLDAAFECSAATVAVCYDDPPRTGYQIVTAMVDGEAQRDSVLVTVVPALILTCSDSSGVTDGKGGATVVRASTVRCRAFATEGTLTVTGWSFASTDGTFSFDRSESDLSFHADSTTWSGIMAMTGIVTVHAMVAANPPTSRSTLVSVTPRDWRRRNIPGFPTPRRAGQGTLPPDPRGYQELGEVDFFYDTTANVAARHGALHAISTGPNEQLVFASEIPPIFLDIEILTNDAALRSGSRFWYGQVESNSGFAWGTRPCSRVDVTSTATLNKILDHEGHAFQRGSHTQVYRDAALDRIGPAVETIVAPDESYFELWRNRLRPVFLALHQASSKVDEDNPVVFGCNFNFRY